MRSYCTASHSTVRFAALSAEARHAKQCRSVVHRTAGPIVEVQLSAEDKSALIDRQRMQMPFYVQCFQSPTFTSGPLSGGCDVLHLPRKSSLVYPTQVFREQPTIQIDVSSCGFYLNSTAVGAAAETQPEHIADLMQPFGVELRPNSTDHDVFLQARHPVTLLRHFRPLPSSCLHGQLDMPTWIWLVNYLHLQLHQDRLARCC